MSPFAKRDYVSHVVHDHTSVLRLIETTWNLNALTSSWRTQASVFVNRGANRGTSGTCSKSRS